MALNFYQVYKGSQNNLIGRDFMNFRKLILEGAFLIEPEKREDDRGFFARVFCRDELTQAGLKADLSQCNISYNKQAGTLRGMHYQTAPHAEVKIVRCTAGAI
jgi:dTDP-4-dehydrorhamnose 3,5-epimerase